jgi:hypothetical protein
MAIASNLTCHANNFHVMSESFLMATVDGPRYKAHRLRMVTVLVE